MDDDKQNSEIEKIANLMVHDGISSDEHDIVKLTKYRDQVKKTAIVASMTNMP